MALRSAKSSLTIDGDQTYSVDAKLAMEQKTVKTVWTPSLTITIPNKPAMAVSGTFVTGTGKTIASVDLSVNNFSRKPITLSSSVSQVKGGSSYAFLFALNSELLKSDMTSTISVVPGNYIGSATLEYSMQGRPLHRFSASGKFTHESLGDLKKYSLHAGFVPTEYPQYQFNINSELQGTPNHIDTTAELTLNTYGKISLAHKTTKQGTWQDLGLESTSSFKYPYMVCIH